MNGLSDNCHPMQALSDLLTMQERFGELKGLKLAYLGDGNNMVHSLLLACAAMGVSVTVASPAAYQPDPDVVNHAPWLATRPAPRSRSRRSDGGGQGRRRGLHRCPRQHGQLDGAARAVALAPYKVTDEVMGAAKPTAVFMHCLPMHREEEVTTAVADGPQSIIFDQAENRLHLQKALLLHTLC